MKKEDVKIGIYGASSQSGMAYFADYINKGFAVIGYIRSTPHGMVIKDSIVQSNGIWLERPPNQNNEPSVFVNLGGNEVTHNLSRIIDQVDIIIIPIPAQYHLDAVTKLLDNGLLLKRVPLVLSPSRTFGTPYLWKVLGDGYPVSCFSTSPYSCKISDYSNVYIKRRKRTWLASLEGEFKIEHIALLDLLFPQAAFCKVPALTSLNNIGAVFHPAGYLMNRETIEIRERSGTKFLFYIEGIADRPEVAAIIEKIDQVRLKIANSLNIDTFGLESNPREEIWGKLINGLRALEQEHEDEIEVLRRIRKQFYEYISSCVISAQHWLDITYGVQRIPGEPLSETLRRTPTYQKNSVPQLRYIHEDIPTGLVPLEALAMMFSVDHKVISDLIDLYENKYDDQIRSSGRNLKEFGVEYVKQYLTGNYNG